MCRESNKWWGEWLSVWLLSLVSTLVSFRERGGCWGKLIYQGHHHCIDSTPHWGQKTFGILLCKLRIEQFCIFYWSFHRNLSRSLRNLSNVSKSKVLNFQGNLNFYFGDDDIYQTRWFKSGPVVQTVLFYGHGQSVTLAFQKKNKAVQWDRKHLCFINASIWFSHWWSIVTFLLISRTGTLFKGRIMKNVKISQLDPDKQNNLVVINYHEQGLNKKISPSVFVPL